ncbi:MAG: M48 family peptidase [Terriglobia bacterium]
MSDQFLLPFKDRVCPAEIFARAFRRLVSRKPAPSFSVNYRKWAQIRSTIRIEAPGAVRVEISDVLCDAPADALEALAEILISRLYRRQPSRDARAKYLTWVKSPGVQRSADKTRRERGFKLMLPARGRCYDLDEIFQAHNSAFFEGQLRVSKIGWSVNPSVRVLGHYDPAHDTITISRLLDSAQAPRLLAEYVLFHEMLHVRYPVIQNSHRRVIHSAEFLAAEKRFPGYRKAQQLLRSEAWGIPWEGRDKNQRRVFA